MKQNSMGPWGRKKKPSSIFKTNKNSNSRLVSSGNVSFDGTQEDSRRVRRILNKKISERSEKGRKNAMRLSLVQLNEIYTAQIKLLYDDETGGDNWYFYTWAKRYNIARFELEMIAEVFENICNV
jgi:hypothetical protein